MATKVVLLRMRLVYCTRDLQMPGSPLLRTAFVLSADIPRFMTGDMSSVVPRCAPLPRSRAGGSPPASAPLLGNRVCTPICPLSYFVTKASGCVLRLEARLRSVRKCQTCLLPQPAAGHALVGARAWAPPAGLRTGTGGPCRLARRASAGERPRGPGAGKAREHRSEASRSTVPLGPGQKEAPLPGMRRSETSLRQEAPGAGAQYPWPGLANSPPASPPPFSSSTPAVFLRRVSAPSTSPSPVGRATPRYHLAASPVPAEGLGSLFSYNRRSENVRTQAATRSLAGSLRSAHRGA